MNIGHKLAWASVGSGFATSRKENITPCPECTWTLESKYLGCNCLVRALALAKGGKAVIDVAGLQEIAVELLMAVKFSIING